ncbi:MAG: hypothetical protein K9J17_16150 [Flavobacteriales bacterium]|nr:hypothetical protein [Flavobacteriales bacterium]
MINLRQESTLTSYVLIPFVTILILISCERPQEQKQLRSWESKKQEILDSLTRCNSLKDSLFCLTGFAYRDALNGSSDVALHNVDPSGKHPKWSAEKWYQLFSKDSLTVYCGGSSNFNASLIREFMSESVVPHGFSIGIPSSKIGHYISLILVKNKNYHNLYLTDPMFNSFYIDLKGDLIDLRTMIYLARKSRTDLFQITQRIQDAQYLQDNTSLSGQHSIYDMDYPHRFIRSNSKENKYILLCPRTLSDYLDDEFASTYVEIARFHNNHKLDFKQPEDFKNCVLFIKDIYGPASKEIKEEVDYFLHSDISTLDSIFANL